MPWNSSTVSFQDCDVACWNMVYIALAQDNLQFYIYYVHYREVIILALMPDLPHAPVSISGLSSQAVLHKRHLAKSFAKLYKILFTVYIRPANHIRNDVHQIRPKLVRSFTIWNLGM